MPERKITEYGDALGHRLWWLIIGRVAAAVILFVLSTTLFSREQSGDSERSALLIFIVVVLLVICILALIALPAFLRQRAMGQDADAKLVLRTATSHEVSALVRRADVTLGLRYSHDPAPGLHCETLFQERLRPVVRAAESPVSGVHSG